MRFHEFVTIPGAVVALILTSACPAQEQPVQPVADHAALSTNPDPRPIPADGPELAESGAGARWISSVRMGREVDELGRVPPGADSNSYRLGDPIFISMQVDQLPPGGEVRVVWFSPDEQQVHEELRAVEVDTTINFIAPPEIDQPGQWRADIFANGTPVSSQRFTIQR
jgi:hypothetical protein